MKRLGDWLAVTAVLLAGLVCANPRTPWLRDGRIYVSPSGCDWQLGDTPERALRTIQCAADRATPGESVVMLPGTYRERLFIRHGGREKRPVTFRALEPGTVLISGAADSALVADLTWEQEGDGLFSCALPWPIYHVTYDGNALFRCGKMGVLKRMMARENAWPSFAWKAGRLYVGMPNGLAPENARLALNGPVPPPREWGIWKATNAWVEAEHLRFEGLRFDFGVGSSLHLWRASDVTVADCAFTGSDIAVHGGAGLRTTRKLCVERCLYHNYPQGRWVADWADWREVYAMHARSALVSSHAGDEVIRGNLILHCGDGVQMSPKERASDAESLITGNIIAFSTDDAFELDGFARGIRIEGNLTFDCVMSLSFSPVLAGPVTVRGNRFVIPHDSTYKYATHLKLLNPWSRKAPPLNGPTRNVCMEQNLFWRGQLMYYNKKPVADFRIDDNTFAIDAKHMAPWPKGAEVSGNRVQDSGSDPFASWHMKRPGPTWLDWASMPATRQLARVLPEGIFTQ